jgi:hypothetical protein
MQDDRYDLDEDDARWLAKMDDQHIHLSNTEFEAAIEILENNSRKKVMSFGTFCHSLPQLSGAKSYLIYDYWLGKRTV